MHDVVVVVDRNGNIMWASGPHGTENVGKAAWSFSDDPCADNLKAAIGKALLGTDSTLECCIEVPGKEPQMFFVQAHHVDPKKVGATLIVRLIPDSLSKLTPREREVLTLLPHHTDQEIAKLLHVSLRTVRAHKNHCAQRTGCKGAALEAYALRHLCHEPCE